MTDLEKRGVSTGAVVGTTVLLGFLGALAVGGSGHPAMAIGALSATGALVLTFGASGLILTVIQGREPWALHAVRWCLVALVGALMVSPGWGTALAVAVALFGLTWRVVEEQRS